MRRLPATLCLLLALCGACPVARAQSPAAQRAELFYGMAQGNYLIGDLEGAEKGIDEILRIDPNHLPALTLQARIRLDQDRPEEALARADRALEAHPDALDAMNLKAMILEKLDRRAEALALLNQVLGKAEPGSRDYRAAQNLLGLLRMAGGEWDAAAQTFQQIYDASPEAIEHLELAGAAYLEKADEALDADDHAGAVAAVSQSIALYEGRDDRAAFDQLQRLRLLRARMQARAGKLAPAIGDLQTILGQQPDHLEARITLASLYAADERWTALAGLLDPLEDRPALADIYHYFEGRVALSQDRVGTARAHFESALDALPDEASPLRANLHFYRSLCLRRLDRADEARTALDEALAAGFRPETPAEAISVARLLLQEERPDDAIPILEAVTLNRLDPSAEAWALLGRAHRADDDRALALSAFNEALAIDPDDAHTLVLRGGLLRKLGDLDGALGDYQAALHILPSSPVLSYETGLTLLQMGRIAEAEPLLNNAESELPDQHTLGLIHATIAYTLGKYDRAQETLDAYADETKRLQETDDSAVYLQYALLAAEDPDAALDYLNSRADSPEILRFRRYCTGGADRKEVLDHAGRADSPETARARIAEAAFWMARHEQHAGNPEAARELLRIAVQTEARDHLEFQLARHLLETPD